jgi:hypothetical protein
MSTQITIDVNELFSLLNGQQQSKQETLSSILSKIEEDENTSLVGKYVLIDGIVDGIILKVNPANNKIEIQRINEDGELCWEVHPVRDITSVKEVTDVDKKLFLSTTPVKDILNREFLKFKLPKEGQEVEMRIHFRENEDVESDTNWVDVKLYKLHGAFCVSLEHSGHEIIGEVFESGQKAISDIYKEMEEIIDEWELGDCIANSVDDAVYGWMHH